MKYFTKIALKELGQRIGKGALKVADKGLSGGLVHNIIEDTQVSKKGSLDLDKLYRTIIGSTIPIILLIALFKGWITIDEVKTLLKFF